MESIKELSMHALKLLPHFSMYWLFAHVITTDDVSISLMIPLALYVVSLFIQLIFCFVETYEATIRKRKIIGNIKNARK